MAFNDFFVNHFETSDNHPLKELRTHYYRDQYNKVKAQILEFAASNNYEVVSVNDEVKEIYIKKSRYDLMITLIEVSMFEIAVDVKSTTYYLIGMKRGLNYIRDLYQYLDRTLNLKGVALYK